jgi:hypothetical protein
LNLHLLIEYYRFWSTRPDIANKWHVLEEQFLYARPGQGSGQGVKLKGYYFYFGVQPFTFLSKYFATLQKGRGNFL